ncbi:hypothetical protein ACFWY9_33555 [Amycolatopsis sp. NPDC059027]|uniref:hypothetical protein n=1 Tax=unclassified Amycolatopsis TaxID=2618356 RepID=UPI00366CE8F1
MRIMGRPRGLIAVLAGALLLSGCGAGPSQVGAAVIIGDRSASVDQVQSLIDKAVREQPYAQQLARQHKLDLVGREVVRQLVVHELIGKAAKQEGLTVDETQLAKDLQDDQLSRPVPVELAQQSPATAVSLVVNSARDHREALTDQLLLRQLGAKYLPKLAVTLDFALPVPDSAAAPDPAAVRAQAISTAKQFAADPRAASEMIKREQKNPNASVGTRTFAAVQTPAAASKVYFGLPVGGVAAFQDSPKDPTSWVVVLVRERSDNKPVAVDQSSEPNAAQLVALGRRMLEPYLSLEDLRVNPRYGVWDVVAMDLAPTEAATQGVVLLPNSAARAKQQ